MAMAAEGEHDREVADAAHGCPRCEKRLVVPERAGSSFETLRITLPAGSGAAARQLPLLIEAAAAVIGVVSRSPLGEPERATGRWLPLLRLGAATALTAVAFGVLAAGSAARTWTTGYLALPRDLAGMTGIALLAAALAGGGLSWVGPLAFWMVAAYAVGAAWATPWIWPGRPPQDRGAALCAALVFAVGAVVITVRGARDSAHE
jgi:hypothetical protein